MKQNARRAFNELKKIGCPVFTRGDIDYFAISAESNNSDLWLNYYGLQNCTFPGFANTLTLLLDRFGLYAEWETPGCAIIYQG